VAADPPPAAKALDIVAWRVKRAGALLELIQGLEELEGNDRSDPLILYAERGADGHERSAALVCPRSEGGGPTCFLDPSLSEVLGVEQAREALEVWSAWRGGVIPTPAERFRSVMYLAKYGAFLPLETDREGM
jgi:hypothetical protein